METENVERRRREDSGACRHENRNGFVDTLLQIVRVVMLFVRANALSSARETAAANTSRFSRSVALIASSICFS